MVRHHLDDLKKDGTELLRRFTKLSENERGVGGMLNEQTEEKDKNFVISKKTG